jgi:Zn-dependent peptidase ImmA (M78 family)
VSKISVNINPKVLKWAREEAGFELIEVANKISITDSNYKNWENKGQEIPLGKLKDLAGYYKRQLAVFFLPEVPEKLKKPKDYRNLKPSQMKLSKEVLLTMRQVSHFQHLAAEIRGEVYWNEKYKWLNEIKEAGENVEEISKWLREKINITIEDQLKFKNESEAYKNWRLAVEDYLGILVFQFPMPYAEVQGFCLTDIKPFAIVINSHQEFTSRIFTLFHELAHIIRNESGICLVDNVEKNQKEEWACNSLAGKILIPSDKIEIVSDLSTISKYAKNLKISREVYLRRVKEQNLISDLTFFTLLKAVKDTYVKIKKSGGVPIPPEKKSRISRGDTFYSMVLEAVDNNRISYTEATSSLGLSVKRILNEI